MLSLFTWAMGLGAHLTGALGGSYETIHAWPTVIFPSSSSSIAVIIKTSAAQIAALCLHLPSPHSQQKVSLKVTPLTPGSGPTAGPCLILPPFQPPLSSPTL